MNFETGAIYNFLIEDKESDKGLLRLFFKSDTRIRLRSG